MFSQVSVCSRLGRGWISLVPGSFQVAGPMALPGWGGVFKGWGWFPWGYPGAKVSRGVYPPPLRNGQYAVVGTHPTVMLSYLFCFHLHFWCQCYQLSRILGRIEVNDNSSFCHSIDRFAFTLAVLLLIYLRYQMC